MRARLLLKSKSDVVLSVAHIKQMMRAAVSFVNHLKLMKSSDVYVPRSKVDLPLRCV